MFLVTGITSRMAKLDIKGGYIYQAGPTIEEAEELNH
jgi:hypothetical protein